MNRQRNLTRMKRWQLRANIAGVILILLRGFLKSSLFVRLFLRIFFEGDPLQDGAAAIGIIGGADGPTAVYIAGKLWGNPSPANFLLFSLLTSILLFNIVVSLREKRESEPLL